LKTADPRVPSGDRYQGDPGATGESWPSEITQKDTAAFLGFHLVTAMIGRRYFPGLPARLCILLVSLVPWVHCTRVLAACVIVTYAPDSGVAPSVRLDALPTCTLLLLKKGGSFKRSRVEECASYSVSLRGSAYHPLASGWTPLD
jgi:hypothetical protein